MMNATCSTSWIRQYYGYLRTEYKGAEGHGEFVCVDNDGTSVPGTAADVNGISMHNVEATCNGLPCPPYNVKKSSTVWFALGKSSLNYWLSIYKL